MSDDTKDQDDIKDQIENAPLVEKKEETLEESIQRLALLSPVDYDRARNTEADRLNIRLSTLDSQVERLRPKTVIDNPKLIKLREIVPCVDPVDGSALLTDVAALIHRHIVCPDHTANAAALWIAFTWFVDAAQVAPLAVITAPEKRCGKSLFLEVIGKLSNRPLVASNISPAAVFRVIERCAPTLLIDEADAFFKDNEELRGIINSGHTRHSAFVIRTVGDDHEPQQFSTWGCKAISGIGTLSPTIMDRSIRLQLKRKLSGDKVVRLRHANSEIFELYGAKLARFAEDHKTAFSVARPDLPAELNDRAQDNWEPLLAIADCAGGSWPLLAREAASKLCKEDEEPDSTANELLSDIHDVIQDGRYTQAGRISTADLLTELVQDDTKPWLTYNRGKPISPAQLSRLLKVYGIRSGTKRIGRVAVKKGYDIVDFEDAFHRYLSSSIQPPSGEVAE